MDREIRKTVTRTRQAAVDPCASTDDWRGLPDREVEQLLQTEVAAWRRDLYWDVSDSWQGIAPARRAGHLPGFVTRDLSGRPAGWTCFFVDRRCLHVMMFVADSPAATRRLVDTILSSPQATLVPEITVFVRDAAPGLDRALAAGGFQAGEYQYLVANLPAPPGGQNERPGRALEAARAIDCTFCDAAARLLARAYAASAELRVFAPNGTPDEWRDYVGNLLHSRDCGTVLPAGTFVAPAHETDFDGLIVTTRLGADTAHIAQFAVEPASRGKGVGRQLVGAALDAAARTGCTRATLLASAANTRALAIYRSYGFRNRANFLAARRVNRAG